MPDKHGPNRAAFLNKPGAKLTVSKTTFPSYNPGDVIIKNHAVALNPLDWKRQAFGIMISSYPAILGSDLAGEVVFSSHERYPAGTRVAAVANGIVSGKPDNASFQNYTAVKGSSVIKLPESIGFREGATLASGAGTAGLIVFEMLGIPRPDVVYGPTFSGKAPTLLVWGGASGVGSMVVQLARVAGVENIVVTASKKHHDRLRRLGASVVVDYASPTAVEEVVAAIGDDGKTPLYVVDPISSERSAAPVVEVLKRVGATGANAKVATTLPWPAGLDVPEGIEANMVGSEQLWGEKEDFANWLYGQALPVWLAEGKILPGNPRVIGGGLEGIQNGLDELKKGVSGEKLVVEL
ncbi:chaperonin 10-like protein [Podospora aff. communis PSN243]|uniref:Chaperonin 10-like protein n=1 Tax=Podospora aff. communis PSN243 TaxID=3040156 RepID=A0AAV9GQR1_9PEZI|nr:chaperonin 10-like protein [Podospora aff. communis PSN243]